jgi:hypothetical protein
MKNYKYSFLALIFALSTVSYSNAYDFCPESKDKDVCSETCTPKAKRHHESDERSPLTMTKWLKAGACVAGYWLWLEHVPQMVESRYGESGKEMAKLVSLVFLVDPIKDVLRACSDVVDTVVDTTLRSVC